MRTEQKSDLWWNEKKNKAMYEGRICKNVSVFVKTSQFIDELRGQFKSLQQSEPK